MPYVNSDDRREYQREYYKRYRAQKRADLAWKAACNADSGVADAIVLKHGTIKELRTELAAALEKISELNAVIDDLRFEVLSAKHDVKHGHR
jgi:hypothetical protein